MRRPHLTSHPDEEVHHGVRVLLVDGFGKKGVGPGQRLAPPEHLVKAGRALTAHHMLGANFRGRLTAPSPPEQALSWALVTPGAGQRTDRAATGKIMHPVLRGERMTSSGS